MAEFNLITILGPTASGKTAFAARLALEMNGEIISADSRQVYRGMDIGTGKDYADYIASDKKIPYHLIDIHEPGYRYNVYEYQKDFSKVFRDITVRGKMPFMVGGTGLYIQAILENYTLIQVPVNSSLRDSLSNKTQEELIEVLKKYKGTLHNTTDTIHRKRTIRAIEIADYYANHKPEVRDFPGLRPLILGIKFERAKQKQRITDRLNDRLESGLIEEVNRLLDIVGNPRDLVYYGLEYKYITLYLTGKMSYGQMVLKLQTAIHQFAKRQMTWFRQMERKGYFIHWIDGCMDMDNKVMLAKEIIRKS